MVKTKPAPEPKKLLPQQILAISRVATGKVLSAARDAVKSGEKYPVDFGVRIQGELLVNHDSSFSSNVAPRAPELIQALLSHFGPRKRKQVVEQIVAAGLAKTIQPEPGEPIDPSLAMLAEQLVAGLTVTGTAARRGAVTGAMAVSVVEWSV